MSFDPESNNKLKDLLSAFDPITLKEMDSVSLLDRLDTKYVFNPDTLLKALGQMKDHYRLLDVNGVQLNKYESLYFDTDNFDMYFKHYYGRANRYKIRARNYVGSALSFFEIKFKNNKGRTIKNRVRSNQIEQMITGNSKELLIAQTHFLEDQLKPVLWNNFTRMTFVSKNLTERLTIDLNLQFKHNEKNVEYPGLVIAEVKHDKSSSSSAFIKLMKKMHVRQGSVSKYCLGVISLYESIKQNNFKRNIQTIKNICNENNS